MQACHQENIATAVAEDGWIPHGVASLGRLECIGLAEMARAHEPPNHQVATGKVVLVRVLSEKRVEHARPHLVAEAVLIRDNPELVYVFLGRPEDRVQVQDVKHIMVAADVCTENLRLQEDSLMMLLLLLLLHLLLLLLLHLIQLLLQVVIATEDVHVEIHRRAVGGRRGSWHLFSVR